MNESLPTVSLIGAESRTNRLFSHSYMMRDLTNDRFVIGDKRNTLKIVKRQIAHISIRIAIQGGFYRVHNLEDPE